MVQDQGGAASFWIHMRSGRFICGGDALGGPKEMKISVIAPLSLVSALLMGLSVMGSAGAALISCSEDVAKNRMNIDDSQVQACLASGVGDPSLTGNPGNDTFLNNPAGAPFVSAGKTDGSNPYGLSYTQNGSTGTWEFSPLFWNDHGVAAIGFKFGTGGGQPGTGNPNNPNTGNPDDWFVYSVVPGVSSGSWSFTNVHGKGGGLSHMNLYASGTPTTEVPEPLSLGLFGLGLLGLGATAMRRRSTRS